MIDEQLKLENIRNVLIRQEETIIFALIERAQYKQNHRIYEVDGFVNEDFNGAFCDYYLYKAECADALIRRYTVPDQHPFFDNLPEPILPSLEEMDYPIIDTEININQTIKKIYIDNIIPYVCEEGSDAQFGSAVMTDRACLNALSHRIHYGKFVAESKFRNQTDEYMSLIREKDVDGIMELLTNEDVETRLLQRVKRKAATYGQDPGDIEKQYKVEPLHVQEIYRKWIIPLTKKVEVDYLLERGRRYENK